MSFGSASYGVAALAFVLLTLLLLVGWLFRQGHLDATTQAIGFSLVFFFGSAAVIAAQPYFAAGSPRTVAGIVGMNAFLAFIVSSALHTYDTMRRQIEESARLLREKEAMERELAIARERNRGFVSTQMTAAAPFSTVATAADARAGAGPGTGGAVATPTSLTAPSGQGTPGSAQGAPPPVAPSTAPLSPRAARKARSAAYAADFLKQYDSPAGRAGMRADETARLARSTAGLQEKLGIDDAKWQKFMDMMVDHEMAVRAAYARCDVDPACHSPDPRLMERFEYSEQAIRELLGRSDYKAMREYRQLAFERDVVANLQDRLPANLALSEKQSDALAHKLREVRINRIDELAATYAG